MQPTLTYTDVMEALTCTPLMPPGNSSKLHNVASQIVCDAAGDRIHSLSCPVCGEVMKFFPPVVCEPLGTRQVLRGEREAVRNVRRHCEERHPNEYVWWCIPTGGEPKNETEWAKMDELMRYILERTAIRIGTCSLSIIPSKSEWSLETKACALSFFIYKRYHESLHVLEYAKGRIVSYKKLFSDAEYRVVREKVALYLLAMAQSLMRQCRQHKEYIFSSTNYQKCINRLQLCYFERGRWRDLSVGEGLPSSLFGLPHDINHACIAARTHGASTQLSKRKRAIVEREMRHD